MLNSGRDGDIEERRRFVELVEAEVSQVSWNRHDENGKEGDSESAGKVNHPQMWVRVDIKEIPRKSSKGLIEILLDYRK